MVSSVGVNPVVVNKPENKKSNVGKLAGACTGLLGGGVWTAGTHRSYAALHSDACDALENALYYSNKGKELLSNKAAQKRFVENQIKDLKKFRRVEVVVAVALATTLGLAIGAIVDKVRDNIKAKKAQKVEQ